MAVFLERLHHDPIEVAFELANQFLGSAAATLEIDWPSQWDGRAIKNKTVEENEGLDENDEKFGERKKIYKEASLGKDYSRAVCMIYYQFWV